MSERDFSAGGHEFKLNKIDPFKQFHIVRRLGPILGDIIPVAQKIKGVLSDTEQTEEQKFEMIAMIAHPILNGLSKLSDVDSDKVLMGLLSAVEIKQAPAGNWARIVRDDSLMIQTLDLPVLLQAAGRAFAYNLSGFFAIAPQTSHGGK
jgi:hypothetical protein